MSDRIPSARQPHAALGAALWAAQVFVALSFFLAAGMKLFMPIGQLAGIWPWTGDLSPMVVHLLGMIDLAGGLGVLLPSLMRIWPGLTVFAAVSCIALQLSAMVFHGSRGEFAALPVNVVLLICCAFIFWGRWKKAPVLPRTAV